MYGKRESKESIRKICFVPWESELESCRYLKCLDKGGYADVPLYEFLNGCAFESYHAYDIFNMLLGKIDKRVEWL